jgi:hypothetical protein
LLRCLAVADRVAGDGERAAERYAEAFDELCGEPHAGEAVVAALGREALEALLGAGRVADARGVWERLPERVRERGRFRLLGARLLLAEGDRAGARAVCDGGVEVPDLREGEEVLGELWARVAGEGEPLPARYDFRMRAGGD